MKATATPSSITSSARPSAWPSPPEPDVLAVTRAARLLVGVGEGEPDGDALGVADGVGLGEPLALVDGVALAAAEAERLAEGEAVTDGDAFGGPGRPGGGANAT